MITVTQHYSVNDPEFYGDCHGISIYLNNKKVFTDDGLESYRVAEAWIEGYKMAHSGPIEVKWIKVADILT